MTDFHAIRAIAAAFEIGGEVETVESFPGGHIHESFLVTTRSQGRRYLLQRFNTFVFPSPEQVMENVRRVTEHLASRLRAEGVEDWPRRTLAVIPTLSGEPLYRSPDGSCWRMYAYIEQTRRVAQVASPEQAYLAAQAFGVFQRRLADLPSPRLHETIPGFHDTPRRFAALQRAADEDPLGRASTALAELEFARRHKHLAAVLMERFARGELPERVVHNDAKIDNLLFDESGYEPLCVVDLDTVMPGLSLWDFGDMVRSMSCPAAEDETDLSRVEVRLEVFEGLVRGYLDGTGGMLTPEERRLLVHAGLIITLEQGVRFLTDYLEGDRYYRAKHPDHNLDRCRNQFALAASILRRKADLERIVSRLSGGSANWTD